MSLRRSVLLFFFLATNNSFSSLPSSHFLAALPPNDLLVVTSCQYGGDDIYPHPNSLAPAAREVADPCWVYYFTKHSLYRDIPLLISPIITKKRATMASSSSLPCSPEKKRVIENSQLPSPANKIRTTTGENSFHISPAISF